MDVTWTLTPTEAMRTLAALQERAARAGHRLERIAEIRAAGVPVDPDAEEAVEIDAAELASALRKLSVALYGPSWTAA